MIRYFSSFIITSFLYITLALVFIFSFSNEKQPIPKAVEKKTLSLNHIIFIKKEEIKVPTPKSEIKEIVKKTVKKEKLKKEITKQKIINKKERTIVKKPVKKKVVKKEEVIIVKKEIQKRTFKPFVKKITTKDIDTKTTKGVDYKKNFIENNLYLIQKNISKNIKYSKRAKKMRIEGNVVIEFNLLKNGDITNIKALSGHSLLIKSTIKAIHKASSSFPKVKENILIKIPINYKLI